MQMSQVEFEPDGDLIMILDADMCTQPHFLDAVVPYFFEFEDEVM